MLGQVLSFPSRQWLSALPPGVPAHPPAPGPARSPTLAISWGFNSLVLCRAVNTRKRERSTNRLFKMKPMCTSPSLWAPAARGACQFGRGRGIEKLERPSTKLSLTAHGAAGSRARTRLSPCKVNFGRRLSTQHPLRYVPHRGKAGA